MDVIYLAYANSQEDPLKELNLEDKQVHDLLSERDYQDGHFRIMRESFATRKEIIADLTKYHDQICLFHYSGHASKNTLRMQDEDALAEGIAELLWQCDNLKLVFLNGCSTQGQVEKLLNEEGKQGVPVVIATSRPVKDVSATAFAVAFYQSMVKDFSSINDAFAAGKGAAKVLNDIEFENDETRGIKTREGKKDKPIWGIFSRHKDPNNLKWTLPGEYFLNEDFRDFKPNKHLFKTLFVKLGSYKPAIEKILRDEDRLGEHIGKINKKDDMVLKSLPHTISEQLRALRAEGKEEEELFNKLGKRRLQQLIRTYNATIQLLVYILLSQLWNLIKRDKSAFTFNDEQKKLFRSIFNQENAENVARYEGLINLIMNQLTSKAKKEGEEDFMFIEEINNPDNHFHKNESFLEACREIERIVKKDMTKVSKEDAAKFCVKVEEYLATVMSTLLFLSKYRLASVKRINVKNQRHFSKPQYIHSIVELEFSILLDSNESVEISEYLMEDSSVILCRSKDDVEEISDKKQHYLNLSPFLFDKNALKENAPSPEIYYLRSSSANKEKKDLIFYPIYNKNNESYRLIYNDEFSSIEKQFDSFCKDFFGEPLEKVI